MFDEIVCANCGLEIVGVDEPPLCMHCGAEMCEECYHANSYCEQCMEGLREAGQIILRRDEAQALFKEFMK